LEKRQTAAPSYGFVYPNVLRQVYNIPQGTSCKSSNSIQMAMEFLPVGAPLPSDVQTFCRDTNEVFSNYTNIFGSYYPGQSDGESTLDVEYLMTIGAGAQNWYYTVNDGWIWEMAVELNNMTQQPPIVSISYGWPELDSCDSSITRAKCQGGTNQQYVQRANSELAKAAARGVSIFAASQDEGAPGPTNRDCRDTNHPVYGVYPSSSPWVTSVSGTTLVNKNSAQSKRVSSQSSPPICQQRQYPCITGPVVEWPCMTNNTYYGWTTGGGFSDMTAMPGYQKPAVAGYLARKGIMIPPSKYFTATNRGYPDISAAGARILTFISGSIFPEAGTSASTPIIAGVISLLNDYRFQNNKAQLGFLNPLLYTMYSSNPLTFNDVTEGDNHCTIGMCCTYGYGATVGWDAVTGLGTPNYQNMLAYIKTLP